MIKRHENLAIKMILGVLCLAVVGLAVGIAVVKMNHNEDEDENEDFSVSIGEMRDAYTDCNAVKAGYIVTGDKTYDEVVAELDARALEARDDVNYYLNYITCYAQFVFSYGSGFSEAVDIMSKAEDTLDSASVLARAGYYYTYVNFYERIGNLEKAKYYKDLIAGDGDVKVTTEENANGEENA